MRREQIDVSLTSMSLSLSSFLLSLKAREEVPGSGQKEKEVHFEEYFDLLGIMLSSMWMCV